jgi:transposase InsO family protein
MIKSQ